MLHDDPLIYTIKSGGTLISGFRRCLLDAGQRPFHILVSPSWDVRVMKDSIVTFAQTVEALNPKISVHVMCPGEADCQLLQSAKVKAFVLHQNAFIDETVFRPQPELGKRFAAIHNAAMKPWKRHDLAWGVERICVVTYRHRPDDDGSLIRGYKHQAFSNLAPDGSVTYLSPEQVSGLICQSNSALILSAQEGANYASGEYQFCGVPTITTPSRGGRAEFLDGPSTIVIEPQAGLVEQAVKFAEKNPLDPFEVRARVMRKAILHRERLIDWMSEIAGERLHSRANANARLPTFKDKLRDAVSVI